MTKLFVDASWGLPWRFRSGWVA